MQFPPDFEFIRLRSRCIGPCRTGKPVCQCLKIPLEDSWPIVKALNYSEAIAIIGQGRNIGVRLRRSDLVIDIDPRNGGSIEALGFDVYDYPVCETPSGGWHVYMHLPEGVAVRHTVEAFGKGIEFKSFGRQVVAPGSEHPNGGRYEWSIFANSEFNKIPPTFLLDRIIAISNNGHSAGEWTADQLEAALKRLDVTRFSDHDKWFSFMSACHEATGGAGEDVFVAWSISDELYAKDEKIIRARWNSLKGGKRGNAGAGTLLHVLLEHGVTDIFAETEIDEFEPEASSDNGVVDGLNSGAETSASRQKAQIKIQGGSLVRNVLDAERELGTATKQDPAAGIFQRGGVLVRLARLSAATSADGIRRAAGTLQILTAGPDILRLKLSECALWCQYSAKKKAWVLTDAPATVARTLQDAAGLWPNTPPLHGIIEAPTLRPDGTLLNTSGYDIESGLFFNPGTTQFPEAPEHPTREDAQRGLTLLLNILSGFPFTSEASRAVALAMILTSLIRFAVRSAPLFAISAPKMGSGKTLLAGLPGYIATGRPAALISQSETPDEERKRMFALLLEGSIVTVIDNCERALKSDMLCTALTEPVIRDRILGFTRTLSVPTSTTWIATGNNIRIDGDLTSRCLLCSLDPECERPEERNFEINLHETVPRDRGVLAIAALTIVRAYVTAAFPRLNVPTFGRFEDWSRYIRAPLVWLGVADPCETRKLIETRDPIRDTLGNLLEAWSRAFGDKAQTVAQVILHIQSDMTGECGDLSTAVSAIAEDRNGRINSREFAKFVAHHERRIERDLHFERYGTWQGAVLWRALR